MSGKSARKAKSPTNETSDVTGIALVASAIGNLWQASDRADLAQDRDHLLSVLREWQADHARLAARVGSLSTAYEALEGMVTMLRKQNAELEGEKQHWRTKCFEAEKKLGHSAPRTSQHSEGKQA